MSQESTKRDTKLNITVGIMALVALFAPAHVQTNEWSTSIIAMTWQWSRYTWDSYFIFNPLLLLSTLPLTFLRPVFIGIFYRMYKGKSTKKRVLIVGVLSELFVEIFFYIIMTIQLLMYPMGYYGYPLLFPVPLLLLIGLIYMRLVPPPEVTSWVDDADPDYWWTKKEEKKKEETKETKSPDIWMDEPVFEDEKESDSHN